MMRHRSLGDDRGQFRLRLLGLAVLVLLGGRSAGAFEPAATDHAFVSDYCTSCHNDVSRKGQLDLTGLGFDASDPANRAVWIKVHDRVKAGEMPPRGKARPDADRQIGFVEGRAIRRRLNRHEYENLAVADPDQALRQFVSQSTWDDRAVRVRYRARMAAEFASEAGVFVIDDTTFPKQGKHSVGVPRQSCGAQGKTANCQRAVSVHHVVPEGHYPLAMRMFLPEGVTTAWPVGVSRR